MGSHYYEDEWADYYAAYETPTFESEAKRATRRYARGHLSAGELAAEMTKLAVKYGS